MVLYRNSPGLRVGCGAIRFDDAAQRDEVARLAGWQSHHPRNTLRVFADHYGGAHPLSSVGRGFVEASGADVLRALRDGGRWHGLAVAGYPLHRCSRKGGMGFGCWKGSAGEAEAVLAACRAARRRKRPLGLSAELTFAGRPAGATSAGTARLYPLGSTPGATPLVTIGLEHLELLVRAVRGER